MSIRFNHASNTITGTDVITLTVEGGSSTAPKPLRINSSSVIIPNKQLPVGESGAVVFDINSKTLKYHNGIQWVEMLSQVDILAPVEISLTDIYTKLNNRVSTVSYSSSKIPSASVSGTNLNIVFPSASEPSTDEIPGLFTSSPPGSIMQYSLTSGQSVASIREQMSGVVGGQTGRDGSRALPYRTKTGWCFSDGLYWEWNGEGSSVVKMVPNLNQNAYLKSISTSGITKTDTVISGFGTISNTTIAESKHYHGTGMMAGLAGTAGDDALFISGSTWNDGTQYQGVKVSGDVQTRTTGAVNGSDTRTALSTTYAVYPNGNTTTHTHNLSNIDVSHFNVAMLYNIAEPSIALNQNAGDSRYVLKAGDTMTGSLSIANSAAIRSNDTNLVLWFHNNSSVERGAIYHSSSTNTLRFRSNGGPEMALNNAGVLTVPTNIKVNNKNVVRSINNMPADDAGNIQIQLFTGLLDMTYLYSGRTRASRTFEIVVPVACTRIVIVSNGSSPSFLGDTVSHTIEINGSSYVVYAYGSRGGSSGHSYYASRPFPQIVEITGTFTKNQVIPLKSTFNDGNTDFCYHTYTIYFKL